MEKIVGLFVFLYINLSLQGQPETSYFSNWSQDSVFFYYIPFDHKELKLETLDFKLYKDTLFVYKIEDYNEEFDYKPILCRKIINKDTVDIVKEFIRLFIEEKTEKIILKEPDYIPYRLHTMVYIYAYYKNRIVYKEQIIMYPEREYNSKYLQLCDLFLCITMEQSKLGFSPLKSQSETSYFLYWNQNKNDSVLFRYYSFDYEELVVRS